MDQNIEEIVREIEDEKALNKISGVQVFRGMLNQPELVSVSSANAIPSGSSYATSQFTVNMPRPVLEAETLQLLAANIPLCTQNFPDTACAFWYYRMDEYSSTVPNPENLFFVRLLPSYYKPEFISPNLYGFNETFDNYPDAATQLALSCTNDLAYDNQKNEQADEDTNIYQIHYTPSDITITYNSDQNKFQMTGLNTAAPLIAYSSADTYSDGTTYTTGQYVTHGDKVYRSLQSGNTGHTPSLIESRTWWAYVTDKLVRDYAVGTAYRQGQYVANGGTIYVADTNIYASGAFSTGAGWVAPTSQFNYRYLVTGYADPNVALLQGNGRRQWSQYALYETGDIVQYQGQTYQASQQNKGWLPFLTTGYTQYITTKTDYKPGDVVYSLLYSSYWKCIASPQTANIINGNPFTSAAFWIPQYWTALSSSTNLPIVGLNSISREFDMMDAFNGQIEYPFPYGVPGQPFNPIPRRLLNSLLGFCWNGLFDPVAVNDVFEEGTNNTLISTSSITTELLNRLRPVPQYYTRYVNLGVGAGQATQAITFTADGYANLVYSSVIAIYSTIVYGSTLDSQRNTNLLGLSSLNAGNLGVSFFDNKINVPLRVKGADIYSIGIELRDEVGELYPITNNGICTFTLKLSYKENRAEK